MMHGILPRLLVDGRPGNNGWDSFYQGIGNFGILNMIVNIEVWIWECVSYVSNVRNVSFASIVSNVSNMFDYKLGSYEGTFFVSKEDSAL